VILTSLENRSSADVNEADPEIEAALTAAIDPWLPHMHWRADFAAWRQDRLWQERLQLKTLQNLRRFLTAYTTSTDNQEPLAGKLILDLGCGMGGLATALALAGAEVQATDFNEQYCNITRLRGMRYDLNLSPINAAGEALPFRDGSFDAILCLDVLEHVRDPEVLLAEISRCLKPGGFCHLTAINRFAFRDPHYHVRFVNWLPRGLSSSYLRLVVRAKDNTRFKDRQTLSEMHYYRYGQLRKLFARHGLSAPVDLGEINLRRRARGLKKVLKQVGLLESSYRIYRGVWKSTFAVMVTKRPRPSTVR